MERSFWQPSNLILNLRSTEANTVRFYSITSGGTSNSTASPLKYSCNNNKKNANLTKLLDITINLLAGGTTEV